MGRDMKKYFLVIDRGQTGIKTALCNLEAEIIYKEFCKCEPIRAQRPGWAEQDMNLIWSQTVWCIKKLLQNNDVCPGEVAAVSLSGQGGGNFLVSDNGRAIYPGVLSLDRRHEEIERLFASQEMGRIPRTIAFMRWLKEKEPGIFGKVRWILGSKDWIRYCLTGQANVDMSDTPVPVNLPERTYITDCLNEAGVQECIHMLPPPVYASEICGAVTKRAAEQTGLLAGTPVAAGAHDMIACSTGTGGSRQGHLAMILGTLGINIAVLDEKTEFTGLGTPGESFIFAGAVPGIKTVTTSIGSGCGSMDWFLEMFFQREKRLAKELGIGVYDLLDEMLFHKEQSSIIFQPYLMGTFYNSQAKAALCGFTAQTQREDILLSMYQGICLSMCMEIEKMEKNIHKFDDLWLTGGGSRSRLWGQMFADALGRPVRILDSGEAGCRGAAICAGIAMEYYSLDNAPKPRASVTYVPREEYFMEYEKQMKVYKQMYALAEEVWKVQ